MKGAFPYSRLKHTSFGDHAVNAEGRWLYTNHLHCANLTVLEIVNDNEENPRGCGT